MKSTTYIICVAVSKDNKKVDRGLTRFYSSSVLSLELVGSISLVGEIGALRLSEFFWLLGDDIFSGTGSFSSSGN